MDEDARRFDVAIVGGGPAGLTLALSLVRFLPGIRVALVERRAPGPVSDGRASAIAAGVRRIFEALGVWPQMEAHAEPVRAMRLTDSGARDMARPLLLDFGGEVAPGEPFAHMVPNTAMNAALLEAVAGKLAIVAPAEVTAVSGEGPRAHLTLADGRVLEAALVVAADGARSGLRRMARIETIEHDYRQSGIVTTIAHELAHEGTAFQHFRPAGPFASLPLPANRSSLVWTETTEEAERLVRLDKEALAEAIEAAMGSTLGKVSVEDRVAAFPLRLLIARSFVGPRLALVGDAAHVIHPIAGQGLNLGLKDVAALAETAIEAMRLGLDPGEAEVLARYQRWRRFDTASMAFATDAINRLFSNDADALRALRDLGLGMVDRAGPVKDMLMRRAAGIGSDGPRLLAGLGI